jgi:hypothetical protein
MMRKLVFTQGYPPYNAGEDATFPDDQAGALVSRGVAVYVDPAPLVAEPDDEPETDAKETKAPDRPPADRMMRPGQAVRKKD